MLGGVREKVALALVQDADGDYALVRVSGRGGGYRKKVLGWMRDEECAEELAKVINMIGNGECDCSFGGNDDIERALRNGIQE